MFLFVTDERDSRVRLCDANLPAIVDDHNGKVAELFTA